MRKNQKTLTLNRDTVRSLDQGILGRIAGGTDGACSFTICYIDTVPYYGKSHCPGATCFC
jgi:hypothetical protein